MRPGPPPIGVDDLRGLIRSVPARRPGKLPAATASEPYELEYGESELHAAALGGLVEGLGGEVVAYGFLIELTSLRGRDRLGGPVLSLIEFDG